MIKTEPVIINNKEYVKSFSDAGMMIERNGRRFSSALDPVGLVRRYTETDKPVPVAKPPKSMEFGPTYREATPIKPVETENLETVETKEETIEQVE